jgi:hypothetical protein
LSSGAAATKVTKREDIPRIAPTVFMMREVASNGLRNDAVEAVKNQRESTCDSILSIVKECDLSLRTLGAGW